jgi:hypothetical protein
MRVLNAMDRPQDLFDPVEHDAVTGFFARMIGREAAVVRRMPIFGGDDEIKVSLQFVGDRDDFITVRHRQGAAGQKVILKIDDDQRLHSVCCMLRPRSPLPFRKGERMKVRGFRAYRINDANPHPTLSLAKGEAEEGSK